MSKQNNRTKWLHLRLTPEEYTKMQAKFSKTTCHKLSDYARKILLDKTVTATFRNQSMDDSMAELMRLIKELNSIGSNFNQAVKKLHSLEQIQEFKSWILYHEREEKMLLNKVEEVKNNVQKMAEKWLQ